MELAIYILAGLFMLALCGYGSKLLIEQYKYQKKELEDTKNSYHGKV